MKKKNIDEIKINELVSKAGVSRMTYYRYFSDKREILEFYMNYIFVEFLDVEKKNSVVLGTLEHVEQCFDYFKQYKEYALCLYNTGMEGIMLKAINKYMTLHLIENSQMPDNRAFALYAYSGAIYNCYMQWILSDFQLSSKEIAQIIYQMK